MERFGWACLVMPSRTEEKLKKGLAPPAQVKRLALEKAEEVRERLWQRGERKGWVLGVDTMVLLGRELLGKPKNTKDAFRMLGRLSGVTHEVLSGVALLPLGEGKAWQSYAGTQVSFRRLVEEEIRDYVRGGEPMDKAGSYGIQGKAGAFVKSIRGDYFNVMGLPVALLAERFSKK